MNLSAASMLLQDHSPGRYSHAQFTKANTRWHAYPELEQRRCIYPKGVCLSIEGASWYEQKRRVLVADVDGNDIADIFAKETVGETLRDNGQCQRKSEQHHVFVWHIPGGPGPLMGAIVLSREFSPTLPFGPASSCQTGSSASPRETQ